MAGHFNQHHIGFDTGDCIESIWHQNIIKISKKFENLNWFGSNFYNTNISKTSFKVSSLELARKKESCFGMTWRHIKLTKFRFIKTKIGLRNDCHRVRLYFSGPRLRAVYMTFQPKMVNFVFPVCLHGNTVYLAWKRIHFKTGFKVVVKKIYLCFTKFLKMVPFVIFV